jgi:transcriptional regulator with XRE-family HTH domain
MQCTTPDEEAWVADASTFGARLALVRQRMGWNMKKAAVTCGIAQVTWSEWERGRTPRNLISACEAISHATGCDVAWLAGVQRKASA